MIRRRPIVAVIAGVMAASLVLLASAGAHEYDSKGIRIDHPWSRPTPPNAKTGAVYMTLINEGETADRLLGAETSVAEKVELHMHSEEGGVVKMRPVAAIEVAPGSPTKIAPGGLHLMLVGLKEPLTEEALFPLTLIFEHAGRIEIEVYVEERGVQLSPGHGAHDLGH